MTTTTLRLPRPHSGQRRVLREAKRHNCLAMGRRWGKTTLSLELLARPALEGYPVAYFAPTYRMLSETWRTLSALLKPVTKARNVTERRIELVVPGGVVEFWSLDQPNVARGRRYKRVVIDEAAMIAALSEAWSAVLRPTLAEFVGDSWMLSTPRGRNFFWECWQKGQDLANDQWMSWQMPTSTNPFIRPEEVAAMRAELPGLVAAQEIDAQFLDDTNGVFRHVYRAATATPLEKPEKGAQYVMGCDWGRTNDSTVLSVLDIATKRQVFLDRFSDTNFDLQLTRFSACADLWKPSAIIAEANSFGGPLIETLQNRGYPVEAFTTTNSTKKQIIDSLALAFEQNEITLLDDAVQTGELLSFEAERLPSGLMRYAAAGNGHDDTVIALALALHGCSNSGPLLLW